MNEVLMFNDKVARLHTQTETVMYTV